jgi:hypothetical protein
MSGGQSQTTNQSQNSQSSPWTAATPLLTSLLNSYGGQSTAVTPAQSAATSQLTSDTSAIPNQGAAATAATNNALNFNTTPQQGMLGSTLNSLQTNLNPIASGSQLNPMNTPGFSQALGTMNQDITNQVGNEYAASGRDPAGAGAQPQTLARGLSQGEGQLISNQYNTNEQNMLGANTTLDTAGNAAATGEAGLGATGAGVNLAGVGAVPGAATAYAAPGATALTSANAAYQTPWTNLSSLLTPSATLGSLGGQTSGTGTSTTTGSSSLLSNILGGVSGAAGLASATGAGGSGGWLTSLLASDKRLKTNIEAVGKLKDGQTVHRFEYKGSPVTHIGLLAQDVAKKVPRAVGALPGGMGMLGVDYRAATNKSASMKEAA